MTMRPLMIWLVVGCWCLLATWTWAQALPPPPATAGSLDTVRLLAPSPDPTLPKVQVAPLQDGFLAAPPVENRDPEAGLQVRVGRTVIQEPLEEGLSEEIVPVILKERTTGRQMTIIPGVGITILEPQSLLLPDPPNLLPQQEVMRYPLATAYPITSHFGWRTHPVRGEPEFHQGIDIGAPAGIPVLAVYSGQVLAAGSMGGLGNGVVLAHSSSMRTRYGHLEKVLVAAGQAIQQGEVIGLVGATGLATGPHLHFELWQKQSDLAWSPLDSAHKLELALESIRATS